MKKYFGLLVCILTLGSCTKEEQIVAWMPGSWNIDKYERVSINSDGTTTSLLSETNVGYWNFIDDPLDDNDMIKGFEFYYNGIQGVQSDAGYVKISEQGNRFILIGGQCIGCDDAYNIEYFDATRFKLTQYAPDTSCSCTFKLIMEMVKKP